MIDDDGFLQLAGFVPLGDARSDFEFTFQMINGRWRLFGLGVHPPREGSIKPHGQAGFGEHPCPTTWL